MSAWWAGLPPAEAAVECGGHVHTLRWQAGVLTAVDHGPHPAWHALTLSWYCAELCKE